MGRASDFVLKLVIMFCFCDHAYRLKTSSGFDIAVGKLYTIRSNHFDKKNLSLCFDANQKYEGKVAQIGFYDGCQNKPLSQLLYDPDPAHSGRKGKICYVDGSRCAKMGIADYPLKLSKVSELFSVEKVVNNTYRIKSEIGSYSLDCAKGTPSVIMYSGNGNEEYEVFSLDTYDPDTENMEHSDGHN
eukprot:TRINITY_DN49378_c0_g1_i1.p1 TRINITY_DN49378_c0_g1~~TRINITY_DN49378_c0_g1_i1.p1  ORF type:complete len:187 (-),score=16.34 TRINITY_DN49378_c0_g1_i1:95-655(-)